MTGQAFVEAFRALPLVEKGRVFDLIHEEMCASEPTEAIKRELDRRIADMEANPDDEFSLEEVMAEVDEVIRKCHHE